MREVNEPQSEDVGESFVLESARKAKLGFIAAGLAVGGVGIILTGEDFIEKTVSIAQKLF